MNQTIGALDTVRELLKVSASIAERADLGALVFLIGMAELEAAQAEIRAKAEAVPKKQRR